MAHNALQGAIRATSRIIVYPAPPFSETLNHVEEMQNNLVQQFKKKPVFEAILAAFGNQIQDLETAHFEMLRYRWIVSSVGVQLDGLGSIVGESREGRGDEEYRAAILVRVLINLCEGTPEEIITIMSDLVGDVELREYYPAALTVRALELLPPDIDPIRMRNFLLTCKPAGVLAHFIYSLSPPSGTFRYDSGPGYDQGRWAGAL